MTFWGKFKQWLYGGTKCVLCKSPLKGQRVQTCSPACQERYNELQTW